MRKHIPSKLNINKGFVRILFSDSNISDLFFVDSSTSRIAFNVIWVGNMSMGKENIIIRTPITMKPIHQAPIQFGSLFLIRVWAVMSKVNKNVYEK